MTTVPDQSLRERIRSRIHDQLEVAALIGWSTEWYTSLLGWVLLGVDVALTIALVVTVLVIFGGESGSGAVSTVGNTLTASFGDTIAWEIFALALFGAIGSIYAALLTNFDLTTQRFVKAQIRLPASAPIAVAVVFFSGIALANLSQSGNIGFLGLAFLGGFSTKRVYTWIGSISEQVFSTEIDDDATSATE